MIGAAILFSCGFVFIFLYLMYALEELQDGNTKPLKICGLALIIICIILELCGL